MDQVTPQFLKGDSSKDKMHDFLKTHYFQWWGDPMQSTTYSTPKTDVHKRLCELIDKAVAEALGNAPEAYGYKEIAYTRESQWSEPPRPAGTDFNSRKVTDAR